MDAASLYLDLMEKTLTGIYRVTDPEAYQKRLEGHDWPQDADTMIGLRRLRNIRDCLNAVLETGTPGDLIEAGVWKGGATILMKAMLAAYGDEERLVYVADSFEGLPPPDPNYPADAGDQHYTMPDLAISLEDVQYNFAKYDLLDDQVRFVKGWFKDTLHEIEAEQFALIRLDGDMYESTIQGFEALYPKLSPGGFLIVDDYEAVAGCQQAVHDYRDAHGITEEIHRIGDEEASGTVYWRKT